MSKGMTMDLENELRQAMAEHVADVGMPAPESLADEARRGYHRKVRLRAMTITAVTAAVAAVAAMPAYHAFRAEPVGAPGRAPSGAPAIGSATTAPKPLKAPASHVPGRATAPATRPEPARPPAPGSHGGGRGLQSLLTYVPAGLRPLAPCATRIASDRQTMSCRWKGSGGMVEVRLIRGASLADATDLGYLPPMPIPARVHDRPAIRGEWPDMGSQVSWIESPGVGVWVGVGRTLNNELMRIAEGVRVTS